MTSNVEGMVARASFSLMRFVRSSSNSSLRASGMRALRLVGLILLAIPLLAGGRLAAQADRGGRAEKPLVSFRSPQNVQLNYTGAARAVKTLRSGGTIPKALASADFNGDGVKDVVAGYAT